MPSTLGIVASGRTGFSPLDLTPALWLDASDTSTITVSSGKASQWRDKSGNARHVSQAVSTSQPGSGSSTQNGLNVLTFDGNDYLEASSFQAVNASDGTWTCVAVSKPTVNSAPSKHVLCADNGITNQRVAQFVKWSALTPLAVAFRSGGTSFDFGPSRGSLSWTYSSTVCSTTAIEVWTNGATDGSGSVTTALVKSASVVGVGANQYGGEYFTGDIAEIILYTSALSTANRQALETYLATKWGL